MERRRAAVGDEGAVREGLAPLRGVRAGGGGHVLVDHLADAEGRGPGVHREGFRHVCPDRVGRRGLLEAHRSAREALGVEASHDGVGVGHRGARAAAAVAGGAGLGAGARGSHLDAVELVDRRDRAAAGADLDHLDDGDAHRQAAALLEAVGAVHLKGAGEERRVVVDEADLGGGAAHVEGEDAVEVERFGEAAREDGAARGARLHQADREARGGGNVRQAAPGSHHQERAAEAALGEGCRQVRQVARHQGPDVGVGARRREAFELADLRAHLGRQGDGDVRQAFGQERADAAFVGGVGIGVEQPHGDAGDALPFQDRRQRPHRVFVQRQQDLAGGVHPLRHGQAQPARHQRPRAVDVDVVLLEAVLVGHLQRVAVALRRDERRHGAAALDERVGGEGGAVEDERHVARRTAADAHDPLEAVQHGVGGVRVGRGHLRREAFVARVEHDVGERAADVHGDAGGTALHQPVVRSSSVTCIERV